MKKILSILLAVVLMITALPLGAFEFKASANQSCYNGFDRNYTLTGNPASDMVAIATRQIGRTQSQFGYTEGWCDNFVSDCAILAGQASAVPQGGDVNDFLNRLLNAGAYYVSSPQAGDVVIFKSGNFCTHAALMSDGVNCINGNFWTYGYSQVEKLSYSTINTYNGWNCVFVRPRYASSVPLTTPTISFNKSSYTVGDTVTVSWKASPSNSNLSHYWIVVTDPSGKEIIGERVDKSKTSYSFTASSVGSYKVKVYATPTGSQSGEGSLTDTKSVTVNAKVTTYTVTYNANGGTGAPSSQTKTHGVTLTLSSTKPTRSGYTFLGWSTSSSATSPTYYAGGSYTGNANLNLYAVWQINTVQVSIRPDGGVINGSTADIVANYTPGTKITLPQPTRNGYDFVCWTLDYSGSNHILEPWGTPLHNDPSFSYSFSDMEAYTNVLNGAVKIEKVSKTNDCPTSSQNMLKITTSGAASPGLGGFRQATNSKKSGVFYHIIIAKIPVGYTIERISNSCGDGAETVWLTSQEGTGEFETYIYKTTCGSTGEFSTFGHVYILGKEATQSDPLVWYVGYSEIFDGTEINGSTKYTVGTGTGILRAIWKEHNPHSCDINCDKCEQEGTTIHTYDNACDTNCNICGFMRNTEHTYDNSCDTTCNICNFIRTIEHTYDSSCDTTCNICNFIRTIEHTYDNSCDTTCNACDFIRTIKHTYDDSFDTVCNICGKERTVGTTGDCTWTLDDTTLTISGNGAMKNYTYSNKSPWGTSITEVIIEDGVTSIGNYAFYKCKNLTSATIPDSVTNIGDEAFEYCTSLTSITIPDSVTSIGSYAFYNCTSLTSVSIPNSVTTIGDNAFDECYSLKNIKVDKNNKNYSSLDGVLFNKNKTTLIQYPQGKTDESYTIPNSVTSIGDWAFSSCDSLKSIIIPDSVTSIGYEAFYYCSSLTSVNIPDSVTSIGMFAFCLCESLKNVYITDIAAWCNIDFYGGNSLEQSNTSPLSFGANLYLNGELVTDLIIPNGVTTIKSSAFLGCSSLTSITISDSVTSIGNGAFCDCDSLTSITIPDSVTSIGYEAFSSCDSLKSIIIPDNVTSIGYEAFYYCTSLTSLTIPDSVTSIGDRAFEYCTSLTSITIGDSVTSIGSDAFSGCASLKTVYYRGSEDDKLNITIGSQNGCLTDATWYYNSCIGSADHTYGDDLVCDECGHKNFVLGDIDGTGEVDLSDVTNIAQYFAGWNVDINDSALDVDGDGLVNLNDLIHLAQYVAGWEVELY